jgi:hypothetical protein
MPKEMACVWIWRDPITRTASAITDAPQVKVSDGSLRIERNRIGAGKITSTTTIVVCVRFDKFPSQSETTMTNVNVYTAPLTPPQACHQGMILGLLVRCTPLLFKASDTLYSHDFKVVSNYLNS